MKTVELVEKVADIYQEKMAGYELGQACVSLIFADENDTNNIIVDDIVKSPDIYDAFEQIIAQEMCATQFLIGMSVDTSGWAAPLNDAGEVEGAPSEHPQRQRVRLNMVITNDGVASVISFQESGERTYDEGSAHGSLSDAFQEAWNSIAK